MFWENNSWYQNIRGKIWYFSFYCQTKISHLIAKVTQIDQNKQNVTMLWLDSVHIFSDYIILEYDCLFFYVYLHNTTMQILSNVLVAL